MISAWYPRYPGDYGRDTAHLTLAQHGAYCLLLDHYYATSGPLPTDVPTLYRIFRAFEEMEREAVNSVLSQFFQLRADRYHNSRADKELIKRAEKHERLSSSGRRGAQKRWALDGQANGRAVARPQPQPYKEKPTPCTGA